VRVCGGYRRGHLERRFGLAGLHGEGLREKYARQGEALRGLDAAESGGSVKGEPIREPERRRSRCDRLGKGVMMGLP
jgi:hypothetical protein